ncbi:MAG: hypothetical protein P8M79_11650, partial [Alphaproteobacteria bacterium]|nr:hypothetical protein [Alphaproteobacteria bacterium]
MTSGTDGEPIGNIDKRLIEVWTVCVEGTRTELQVSDDGDPIAPILHDHSDLRRASHCCSGWSFRALPFET